MHTQFHFTGLTQLHPPFLRLSRVESNYEIKQDLLKTISLAVNSKAVECQCHRTIKSDTFYWMFHHSFQQFSRVDKHNSKASVKLCISGSGVLRMINCFLAKSLLKGTKPCVSVLMFIKLQHSLLTFTQVLTRSY